MSVEVYEPVQLIVDNLVLQGTEANLVSTNAVSKAYVDSHISSAVSALVDSAPATLDTLKEIATALGNDANLASTLANSIGSEATARIAGDASLLTQINTKVTDVGNWAGNLVHVEQVARIAGDLDESKRAMTAESKEATDRATADAGLQSQITALSGSSGTSVSTLQAQITAEVSARSSGDSILRTDFNEGDRLINEQLSTLSMNLENEGTSRNDADVELSTRCDNLVTSVFNEKAERKSEDVLIRASIVAVNEDLASESVERASAVSALQSSKFDKAGGVISGDVQLSSYLKFSDFWRVSCSNVGSKILFQHKKADGIWRTALPFICSV